MTDNLYICGNQFLLDSYYKDYEDIKPFMNRDPEKDYSRETSSFNAWQFPMWRDPQLSTRINHRPYDEREIIDPATFFPVIEKITKWTRKRLYENCIYYDIEPAISWMVDYREGGWQSVHSHGKKSITQVIYTEAVTEDSSDGKGFLHGAFYAFMTDGNPPCYKALLPESGKCIIAKGDVFHGVYPVRKTPRKCLIIDYIIL
jgi:hypothetical protein